MVLHCVHRTILCCVNRLAFRCVNGMVPHCVNQTALPLVNCSVPISYIYKQVLHDANRPVLRCVNRLVPLSKLDGIPFCKLDGIVPCKQARTSLLYCVDRRVFHWLNWTVFPCVNSTVRFVFLMVLKILHFSLLWAMSNPGSFFSNTSSSISFLYIDRCETRGSQDI